jgi:hypothetical protein
MSEAGGPAFVPSDELRTWARATFIVEDAALLNEDHAHLGAADVCFLWTSVANSRGMNSIVGQAEFQPPAAIGKWQRARAEQQLTEWFGDLPDFLITLDASYASQCSDAEFCSLVEHELYHCGQAKDEFGAPKFTKYGRPVFAMRGHDVEEFVGIVRRYGVGAAAGQTFALVEAAKRAPEIEGASIRQACGTCLKQVA